MSLVAATEGGILGCAGGRFFAWVIGGALPSALAADWLISTWDQNAALYACSPAAAVVEEVAGAWLKDLLGLPEQASAAPESPPRVIVGHSLAGLLALQGRSPRGASACTTNVKNWLDMYPRRI